MNITKSGAAVPITDAKKESKIADREGKKEFFPIGLYYFA